jgi:hypothetical protein
MKKLVSVLLIGLTSISDAAVQHKYVAIQDRPGGAPVVRMFPFEMEIIGDKTGRKAEVYKDGLACITAQENEKYRIRVKNPLPVRVAVALSVDGLNTLTGQPSGTADGRKWIIEPYKTLEIRGWQVNGDEARRFFFTRTKKSYAAWREKKTGLPLSENCGVIGAAFLRNHREIRPAPAWERVKIIG